MIYSRWACASKASSDNCNLLTDCSVPVYNADLFTYVLISESFIRSNNIEKIEVFSDSSKSSWFNNSVKLSEWSYNRMNLSNEKDVDCVNIEYEINYLRWNAWKRIFSSRIIIIWENQGNVIWIISKD